MASTKVGTRQQWSMSFRDEKRGTIVSHTGIAGTFKLDSVGQTGTIEMMDLVNHTKTGSLKKIVEGGYQVSLGKKTYKVTIVSGRFQAQS